MVNNHESFDSFENKQTGSEIALPDFMLQNFEQDPDWFIEPEDTPDYGPPGMPTPLVPTDDRIVERQRHISNTLRGLVDPKNLPKDIDMHLVQMLQMNFDSYNAILGVNNNGSYSRYKAKEHTVNLPPDIQAIEEPAVLGVANQSELIQFILHTDGMPSTELMKIYHPFMIRMRHLPYRRAETDAAIVENGGKLAEISDDRDGFYDLKLYPYNIERTREHTTEELIAIELLEKSIAQKNEAFRDSVNEKLHMGIDSEQYIELYNEIASQIGRDETELNTLYEAATYNETVGLMASIKRRVGSIPKNNDVQVNVTERQLFAIAPSALHKMPQEDLQHLHARRKELDEQAERITSWVRSHFIKNTEAIIPVSTTTYAYETKNMQFNHIHQLGALVRLAEERLRHS